MNELPPDPHLQAALRHAPDALLEAPPELAARVLAEARKAVAPAPVQPWWARWWQKTGTGWLPQGAFATLLLAGLITLLWRDDQPGPAVEPGPMAESPLPAPSPAVAPAPAPAPAVADAATVAPAPAPAPREAARQAARLAKAADTAPSVQAESRQEAAPAVQPPPPAPPAPAAPLAQAPAGAAMEAAAPPPRPAPAAAAFNRAALAAREPAPAPWGDPPGPADRLSSPAPGRSADPSWLATLERSVAAPWEDTASAPPAGEPVLVWEREGAPYGRLWIERREARNWVVWCATAAGQARCRQAPLRGEAPAVPR